jgi:tryptophan-rich sensory protein
MADEPAAQASGEKRPPEPTGEASLRAGPPSAIQQEGPGAGFVPRSVVVLLPIVTTALAVLILYSLWAFWPKTGAGGKLRDPQTVNYFGWTHKISLEILLFLVVALAGALGGLIHTIRSASWYVGNRRLRWSWLPFNLMLPVIGALAGTVFYLVLRAGLFSPSSSVTTVSPFGFTAVAVLAGLFSEQAMEKLKDVATQLFAERPVGEDHVEPEGSTTIQSESDGEAQ